MDNILDELEKFRELQVAMLEVDSLLQAGPPYNETEMQEGFVKFDALRAAIK
jgi:hypothetical protein